MPPVEEADEVELSVIVPSNVAVSVALCVVDGDLDSDTDLESTNEAVGGGLVLEAVLEVVGSFVKDSKEAVRFSAVIV